MYVSKKNQLTYTDKHIMMSFFYTILCRTRVYLISKIREHGSFLFGDVGNATWLQSIITSINGLILIFRSTYINR
jgi:hypothetical protein